MTLEGRARGCPGLKKLFFVVEFIQVPPISGSNFEKEDQGLGRRSRRASGRPELFERRRTMKKIFMAALSVSLVFCFIQISGANGKTGEELFEQHCSMCHPHGGNIVNPDFTLHKKDRDRHGVKTAADIMGKMRNPGPGMTQFTKQMVSDKDAKKIAHYILKTFK